MTEPLITARGFVNTWECDENHHMNMQFYMARLSQASAHFLSHLNTTRDDVAMDGAVRTIRHLRYHHELYAGDLFVIKTHAAARDDGFALIHHMISATSNDVVATGHDIFQGKINKDLKEGLAPFYAPIADDVAPKSLSLDPLKADISPEALIARGFVETNRGMITPAECGSKGMATDQAIVLRVSDAAAHLWQHVGITKGWLARHSGGRVAVETRLSTYEPLVAGDLVHVLSGVYAAHRSSITGRHYIYSSYNNHVAAICEVSAVIMDLTSRKVMPFPDDIKESLDARLASVP